jgi:phenylacetate-CoA ligase
MAAAIDDRRATGHHAGMDDVFARYLTALTQIEKLPVPHLLRYQQGLIERLVRHAREHVPFYRDRLAPLFDAGDRFDFARWSEVPVLDRREAARETGRMRAHDLAASYGDVREIRTSGTAELPLTFTTNGLVTTAANGALTLLCRWHGIDTARALATIKLYPDDQIPPLPDGEHTRGWSEANPDSHAYGLDMRTPMDEQLAWLERTKAPCFAATPSHAMAVAFAAGESRGRSLGLEFVFSIAETVLPRARAVIRDLLGAKLVAIYSCQEIGFVGIECPVSGQYHIVMDNALVEIVDADGVPAKPGEIGRVLVTGLYNYATPFIRYALGDVATVASSPCACGRTLPLIAQVEGRTRAEFIFRDGTRMWPRGTHSDAIRDFVPYREFQMVQTDYDVVEFRYIAQPDAPSPDLAGLKQYGRDKIHPSVDIRAVAVEAFPRGRGGKHEHFLSLVSDVSG